MRPRLADDVDSRVRGGRAIFILFGTLLLQSFRVALAAFGLFLVYSGIKAELGTGDDEEDAVGFQAFAERAMACVG